MDLTPADRTRLIFTPNPVTCDGQRNIAAQLVKGETLSQFLARNVPEDMGHGWEVRINGVVVPVEVMARVRPKDGTIIEVRSLVKKQALYIVAMVALSITPIVPIKVFSFLCVLGVGLPLFFSIYLLPLMLDLWAPKPQSGQLRNRYARSIAKLFPDFARRVSAALDRVERRAVRHQQQSGRGHGERHDAEENPRP